MQIGLCRYCKTKPTPGGGGVRLQPGFFVILCESRCKAMKYSFAIAAYAKSQRHLSVHCTFIMIGLVSEAFALIGLKEHWTPVNGTLSWLLSEFCDVCGFWYSDKKRTKCRSLCSEKSLGTLDSSYSTKHELNATSTILAHAQSNWFEWGWDSGALFVIICSCTLRAFQPPLSFLQGRFYRRILPICTLQIKQNFAFRITWIHWMEDQMLPSVPWTPNILKWTFTITELFASEHQNKKGLHVSITNLKGCCQLGWYM